MPGKGRQRFSSARPWAPAMLAGPASRRSLDSPARRVEYAALCRYAVVPSYFTRFG